jgi:ATP-dependent RNA helicase DDX23/PRP28
VSIDEMLRRKKASQEAASKPKFLSKEERARLAIERRQKEVAAKKAEQNNMQIGVLRNRYGVNGDGNGILDHRDGMSKRASHPSPLEDHRMEGSDLQKRSAEDNEDSEMLSMRARYMGVAPQKTKKRRLNDRKFVFDWSTDTDTSILAKEDVQPLNVGFGRGHMGGFESKNSRRGELDKHWRDKVLSDMTERDWRIFREDFNIATKGAYRAFTKMLTLGIRWKCSCSFAKLGRSRSTTIDDEGHSRYQV